MSKSVPDVEQWLTDESFQRWLANKATTEEKKRWSAWLRSDFHHQEIYQEAVKLWRYVQFQPASLPDIDQEWERLQRRLDLEAKEPASLVKLFPKKDRFHRSRSLPKLWFRYGAIAAAMVLIFLFWHYLPLINSGGKTFQTATTDYGQRVRITLPEGTTIILNANSTLRYPTTWTKRTVRQFELKGEAYFIVSSLPKGEGHKFCVETNDGKIEVVGTRFAVYERGTGTRVAVEEGCVKVYVPSDSSKHAHLPGKSVMIKSGNLLEFHKGDQCLKPKSGNVRVYTSWWTDQLVFDNTLFEEIITRLQDTYGVQIKVVDEKLLKRSISGSIENTNLQIIISALAKALQIPVHRERNIIIFGKS